MLDSQRSPGECRSLLIASTALIRGTQVLRSQSPDGAAIVLRLPSKGIVFGGTAAVARNVFQPTAIVRFEPAAHGAQVQVTLRSDYVIAAFMTLWLGFAVLFSVVTAVIVASGAAHLLDLAATLVLPVFGFSFMALGRRLSRPERTALLDFISQATGVRRSPDATPPLV